MFRSVLTKRNARSRNKAAFTNFLWRTVRLQVPGITNTILPPSNNKMSGEVPLIQR